MGQTNLRLKNCTEELAWECLNKVLTRYDGICTCERCKQDIFAIALNNLPPRYVVSDIGETYTKVQMLDNDVQVELLTAIALAVDIVKKNPRHNVNNN